MMEQAVDAEKAINYIRDSAGKFAKAKAERVYIQEYRKSLKAILVQKAPPGTVQERESFAYAHPEYLDLLQGLRAAVEEEERLRYMLKAAESRFEAWRTEQATIRSERQRYGA